MAMDLGPLLNAHAYLRVERPPRLWEADIDDVALVRVLGEMIAAALARGTALGEIVLRVNNVTVEPPDNQCSDTPGEPRAGDYVALTIVGGEGDWRPELSWRPGAASGLRLLNADLVSAATAAGIPFAYTRSTGAGGSVTVFLPRGSWRGSADRPE
ncbi:MAG: hypothetical protein ACRDYF_02900 [Acidimicrobiia bacterium]